MNFTSNLQVNNLFKGLTQSLQAQQSQQAQAIKLEDLINKYTGLGRIEKDVIFNYVKNGESQVKQRKDYITNVIIIFNSFFEYGFLHKSISSSSGKSSSYADEWADGDDSNQLGRVEHYWEYMTVQFTDLDTVRYINFYYEEASNNREKALGWILLALNQKDELQRVVMEIFSCIPILQLYSKQDSYLWANRKEILECIDLVNQKSMYNPCPLLDNYIEFGKKKEEKKVNQNFLAFLENEEDEEQIVIQTSARRPDKQNSPISTQNKSQDGSGSKKDQLSNKSALKQYISQSDGGNNLKDQQEDIIGARFQKQNQQFKQEHDDEQSSVVFDPKNSLNNSKDHEDQASSQSQIFRIKTSRNEVGSFAHSSGGESQINIKQHNYGTVSAVNNNLYQIDRQLERQSNQSSRNEANEFTPRKHTETLIINYDRISLSSMNESNFRQNFNQVSNSHVTIANSRLNLFSNNEILAENNPSKSPSPEQTSKVNFNYDTNISPNNKGWLTIRDNNPFQPVQELEDIFKANLSQKFFINEMPTKDNRINDTSFNTRSVHSVKYNDAFKNKTQREYRDSQYSDQNENQQSIGLEDSRRIIDKILNEENINVPQEFRKQFKMIYKDLSGNKYKQDLKNSELVFFNEYYDKFKILEYTYQKKTIFMKKKDQIRQNAKNIDNICGSCLKNLPPLKLFGFIQKKHYCYFCLDYTCKKCMADDQILIPCEFQLKFTVKQFNVCKDAFDYLSKFQYLKIDKKNPILHYNMDLRLIMVMRRKLHKLFDLIKCNKWLSILGTNGYEFQKNLILREAYFTFDQLCNQQKLFADIKAIAQIILDHIQTCPVCYYKGEKCMICLSSNIIKIYDVENVGQCYQCRKKGHRICIQNHQC